MMEEVLLLENNLLEEANQYAKKYYRSPNGAQGKIDFT